MGLDPRKNLIDLKSKIEPEFTVRVCFWCKQFTKEEHHNEDECIEQFKAAIMNLFTWVERRKQK